MRFLSILSVANVCHAVRTSQRGAAALLALSVVGVSAPTTARTASSPMF